MLEGTVSHFDPHYKYHQQTNSTTEIKISKTIVVFIRNIYIFAA